MKVLPGLGNTLLRSRSESSPSRRVIKNRTVGVARMRGVVAYGGGGAVGVPAASHHGPVEEVEVLKVVTQRPLRRLPVPHRLSPLTPPGLLPSCLPRRERLGLLDCLAAVPDPRRPRDAVIPSPSSSRSPRARRWLRRRPVRSLLGGYGHLLSENVLSYLG